jgi:TolB-like protein/lipoprotein NlpI
MQTAEALKEAHEHDITHRDIKSDNIMVTEKGQVKVTDFGIARVKGMKTLTKEGITMGTVAYMSPEQAKGKEVDHQTDIWSFGVVLYEMITGELPFKGEYELAIIYSILNEQPEPASRLRTGILKNLDRIVNKALSKNIDERYQHVVEILVELKPNANAVQIGKAKKWSVRSGRLKGKRLLSYGAVATIMILLIIAGSYLLTKNKKQFTSIAVLPLQNLSGDPTQEYFVDGIHDELIASLAKIRALTVISRTSVMQYKEAKKSLPEIAEVLNVDVVVEGTVRLAGDRVRISVQLIDASNDRHIWAENYERELTNIFALQNEVAQDVARNIQAELTPEEYLHFTSARPVNPEAYRLYLKGRYHWNKRTSSDFNKAVGYFLRSIETDSNYAQAYAGLADCYGLFSVYLGVPPKETMPKAKSTAIKALEIDKNIAQAHATLGWVMTCFDYDWVGAEREFRRALELNSNDANMHLWYGMLLSWIGRHDEALDECNRARELDPLSLVINANVGNVLYNARRYNRAIEELQKALDLEPDFFHTRSILGLTYLQKGMYEQAILEHEKAVSLIKGQTPAIVGRLGCALGVGGKRGEALEILNQLKLRREQNYAPAYYIAAIHLSLGDKNAAIDWLQKAYDERDSFLPWLRGDPPFDPLRSDPRFQHLMERINFPK